MRLYALLAMLLTVLGCASPTQADWPNWRGPEGTGVAPDTKTVDSFDLKTGKNIRWATEMPGSTAATPIVVGDRVFSPAGDMDKMRLYACGLDRKTGKLLWKHDIAPARKSRSVARENHHAECTPVADDKHVYFIFGTGDLIAYTHDGQKKWHINLSKQFGKIEILWGYGSSLLMADGKLYVQVLRRKPDSFLLCVDPSNGQVLWKNVRPTQALGESLEAYTSPIACTIDGKTQIVLYGGDALTGHDAKTGKELWRFTEDLNPNKDKMFRVISGPTQGLNGMIYFTSPRGRDLLAVEVKNNTPKLKWFKKKVDADVPCPVYYKGNVFVLSGGEKELFKFNAETGDKIWSKRLDTSTFIRCTPTIAGGNLYLIDGQGQASVINALSNQFELKSKADLGGYPARACIAASGDALYIRTGTHLICAGK